MLRPFFVFICYCLSLGILPAQLPDGSIAPDFVVEDIQGNTHHLHDYLEQGKTVILEIGTTWCNPCWTYAQTGALNDIDRLLGSDGLDNTVVLFIEGEAANSIDQIYGIQGSSGSSYADWTYGDWTKAMDYPIIDNSAIADLYKITYYPTVFKICPTTRSTHEIGVATADVILDNILHEECLEPTHSYDIALLQYTGTTAVCPNSSLNFPLEIINMGSTPSNPATLIVENQSGILLSQAIDASLQTFERMHVEVGPISLPEASNLLFRIVCDVDENSHNNFREEFIDMAPVVEGQTIRLDMTTDNYGFENYWEIRDLEGNTYYSGGNVAVGIDNGGWPYINLPEGAGAYGSFQHVVETMTLPADNCYEFVLVDDYGDGICCEFGEGSYQILDEFGNVLLQGGSFYDYDIQPFSIEATVTSTLESMSNPIVSCYPNPTSEKIYLNYSFSPNEILLGQLFNLQGQPVLAQHFSAQQNEMDISALSTGIYLLSIPALQQNMKVSIIR